MTTEEKDAEIERIKGENASLVERMERGKKLIVTASEVLGEYGTLRERMAEALQLLRWPYDNCWNITIEHANSVLAFLQKHTPPNCPLETGLRPCMCDLPRCPICSYTEHDARFEGDHSRCKGEIPGSTPSLPAKQEDAK